jgi:FkbM family methyltransferase
MSLYWKNMLLLKAMRCLAPFGNYPMPLRINGRWLLFNDAAKSNTREIVLSEIEGPSKFYKLPESIPDDAIVLDIGAHVGIFSIPLAINNPDVTFVCVEPNKQNYANLWRNVQRYNLKNVVLVNAGIWDGPSDLTSVMDRKNSGGSRTFEIPRNVASKNHVHGFSLPDLRELFCGGKDRPIWLLKMDCEGAEFKAIRTMRDLKGIERVIGEIHAEKGNSKKHEKEVLKMIKTVPKYRLVHLNGPTKTDIRNW